MMNNTKTNWIIGVGGSDMNGVDFSCACGAREEVKEQLFNAVLEERKLDKNVGHFEFGTRSAEDVVERQNGCLYAYNCFSDYKTDYEAMPIDDVPYLGTDPEPEENYYVDFYLRGFWATNVKARSINEAKEKAEKLFDEKDFELDISDSCVYSVTGEDDETVYF